MRPYQAEKPATSSEERNISFHKLTPSKDVDISIYEEAFGYVFSNNDVRNVALSGPYGAGKSSVLEGCKKKVTNKKFLHVSLADFKPHNANELDSVEKTPESVLEAKILNQLIHQISPDAIPQTGFSVKKRFRKHQPLIDTTWLILIVLLTLYQFLFAEWKNLTNALEYQWLSTFLHGTTLNTTRLLLLILEVALLACGIYYAVKKQRTTGLLKKINLQGNEFEIGKENDESFFDKYLNEVLYLFENVDADVIVFEDLDRHESSAIFTRLREINTLVNQHRPSKPLRFFYLIRDDIFATKDRAKFFDFIIPIVPVIDGSNAYDKFLEFFRLGGIEKLFSARFLQGLSLYVDEMRVMKNIINEFQLYYHKLSTPDLDGG